MPPKKPALHKKTAVAPQAKPERYIEAIGRRKTAVARVRIFTAGAKHEKRDIVVNQKPLQEYFRLKRYEQIVFAPYVAADVNFKASVQVKGGGLNAQAEAIRLGIARALVVSQGELRPKLKAYGFLKRDPRMVERKKYGSRKARRPQQWRKR
ncbi:MAG: 30S ribosomal protein S9 [Candidatus Jorgensenbacteria bacterium GW2011_GWA1_48_11]|uniref:30S ribosomal protein S9 n=1 Tax=Candidatus Jorgensenbacteria bacterium GW2011_GWA1_48_11 TaxID=1618660 RepID=A0A0G1XA06_9BACT|nr:MAG: 30S ribosomal protein S9 [Candidatus Jorgensenbacteria bacterium GW2011_GWA1_48_11]KKW11846.1 MAG: 30S ribosomal protein S9 [Candidatus Jorgensenbacteria bacterium GW2011_GWB1_49_9]